MRHVASNLISDFWRFFPMAIKMRVLYSSTKKKMADLATMIRDEFQLDVNKSDKIPPAYACEKERLVILLLSLKGDPDDQLRLFCQELTPARAQNVALIIDGNQAAADRMKEILRAAGTNVADDVHFVKCSFLSFLDSVKPEEKAAVMAWAHKIVDNIQ